MAMHACPATRLRHPPRSARNADLREGASFRRQWRQLGRVGSAHQTGCAQELLPTRPARRVAKPRGRPLRPSLRHCGSASGRSLSRAHWSVSDRVETAKHLGALGPRGPKAPRPRGPEAPRPRGRNESVLRHLRRRSRALAADPGLHLPHANDDHQRQTPPVRACPHTQSARGGPRRRGQCCIHREEPRVP